MRPRANDSWRRQPCYGEPVGYDVKTETVHACGADLQLRSLLDRQQFFDPDHLAELEGISEAEWPLFGVLWPSSRVLAFEMTTLALSGQRILEVGCGLALASIVLHRRAGDVTGSDCHPLVPDFLAHNLELNGLGAMPYHHANWVRPNPTLGRFDLIIGSDVLYEAGQPGVLSRFIDEHLETRGRVMLVDPNRSERARFTRDMEQRGFGLKSTPVSAAPGLDEPYRGRLLDYQR
jgi:2-polyprenyl-3-methyl-5-hydroxy-6-metoxy-1,4-benzoquinol methylase